MSTTPPDPIGPIVTALSNLVTLNPALPTGGAAAINPNSWAPGGGTTTGLVSTIQPLITALLSSSSTTSVGQSINTALTDVASVLTQMAAAMWTISQSASSISDVTSAMGALQSSLSLAQSIAPGSSTAVLNSASGAFQQIQNLLSNLTGPSSAGGEALSVAAALGQGADELAALAQQLTALATVFAAS